MSGDYLMWTLFQGRLVALFQRWGTSGRGKCADALPRSARDVVLVVYGGVNVNVGGIKRIRYFGSGVG